MDDTAMLCRIGAASRGEGGILDSIGASQPRAKSKNTPGQAPAGARARRGRPPHVESDVEVSALLAIGARAAKKHREKANERSARNQNSNFRGAPRPNSVSHFTPPLGRSGFDQGEIER